MSPSSPDEAGLDPVGADVVALAVYGTLAPGERNHHHLSGLTGTWTSGVVHGHLHEEGWGLTYGFPGVVLDPSGPAVPVQVLTSADLPAHWARLDDFEGPGYVRVVTTVRTADGEVPAHIYAIRRDSAGTAIGGSSDRQGGRGMSRHDSDR